MSGTGRWWRRNRWGVLAVLPLVAAVVAIGPDDSYQTWRSSQPREAVRPAADGWAGYGPTRVRLVGVEPADLRDPDTGEPYRLPPGLRAWQATVTFERYPNPDQTLVRCRFLLEDELGRRYGDGPDELLDAELPGDETYLPSLCLPDAEAENAPTFEALSLFVLPSSAEPVAVWLTAADQLPSYVRFELD